jgi:hypothetical protein
VFSKTQIKTMNLRGNREMRGTSPLHVVWGQPTAQGLSRKRELFFNTDMLQQPTSWRRECTSFKLSGPQACKRRDAKKEVQKNTKDYDCRDVLIKIYHPINDLRSGYSKQLGPNEANRSTTGKKSVSLGSNWKQFDIRRHTGSNNCSTTHYDRVQKIMIQNNLE